MRAQLHVSVNAGNDGKPGVYTTGGDWQLVSDGSWELLDGRIGVRITCDNPNHLFVGKPPKGQANPVGNGGVLQLVKALAAPDTVFKVPTFRLTCVIEADMDIDAIAKRRVSATSNRTVTRRYEVRDRFVKHLIDKSSINNNGKDDIVDRDDTKDAQAYADALRESHESAPISAVATIPWMTMAYRIGVPIRGVYGRKINLRVNQGAPAGEVARYPVVSSIEWNFDGVNTTTLNLETRQFDPPPRRRR